jgi:tetratricopeptide (TPR) repeat protein
VLTFSRIVLIVLFSTVVVRAETGVSFVENTSTSRRVFRMTQRDATGREPLALARSHLLRRIDQSKKILHECQRELGDLPDFRWLEGRIALREGRLEEAFERLAPIDNDWSTDPYTLWDFAIVATVLNQDAVAISAYERLLQTNRLNEVEGVAVRLELAMVLSRGTVEQRETARWLVGQFDDRRLDPDRRPWVNALRVFIDALEGRSNVRLNPETQKYFTKYLRDAYGARATYGQLVATEGWLHLPSKELYAIVAIAIGCRDLARSRTFWSLVDASEQLPLGQLRKRVQAAQCKGGMGVVSSERASLAPSPS